MKTGQVVWLGVRPGRSESMIALSSADFDVSQGLVGDRYARAAGKRQVTLIQSEHLAAIASYLGRSQISLDELRRNVVTRGINLLALKDKRFRIGSTILETTGECHPCSRMEAILGVGGYNAVRGHGGITARVIENGSASVGDVVAEHLELLSSGPEQPPIAPSVR